MRKLIVTALILCAMAVHGCQCNRPATAPVPPALGEIAATAPPCVVLVTIDTLRADRVGIFAPADECLFTPHLDALAQSGTRFTNCFTVTPLTLPAHASILTGLSPIAHNVRDNVNYRLPADAVTLAEIFRANGYETAAFVSAETVAGELGLAQGFDTYDDARTAAVLPGFTLSERPGRETMDRALAWLDAKIVAAQNAPQTWRPFFVWVHLFDPHFPYAPEADLRPENRRRPAEITANLPPDEANWRRAIAKYDAEVTWADHQFGRLVGKLSPLREAGKLTLAVMSDHGEALGEHGEATHGFFCYRETMRVPLIVAGPHAPPNTAIDAAVSVIDVAPALLDMAGISNRAGFAPQSAGLVGIGKKPATARATPPPYFESFFGALAFGYAPIRGTVGHFEAIGDRVVLWSETPETYAIADAAQSADLWPATSPAERQLIAAHFAEFIADLDRVNLANVIVPRRTARGGGIDMALYPGAGAAPHAANSGPASDSDGTADAVYGTTYPARNFADSLTADAIADAPSPMRRVAEIRGYQRAQRLASAGKLPLARAVLTELLAANPQLAPAWLMLTECWRLDAEQAYNALVTRHRSDPTIAEGARENWLPRGPERAAILALYAHAADAYRRYVNLMLAADPADDALAAELRQLLAVREFFAGRYRDAERELAPFAPRDLRPRARLVLALSLHFQGGTEFARLVLLDAAPQAAPPAGSLADLHALLAAESPPTDPADLCPRFGFP